MQRLTRTHTRYISIQCSRTNASTKQSRLQSHPESPPRLEDLYLSTEQVGELLPATDELRLTTNDHHLRGL